MALAATAEAMAEEAAAVVTGTATVGEMTAGRAMMALAEAVATRAEAAREKELVEAVAGWAAGAAERVGRMVMEGREGRVGVKGGGQSMAHCLCRSYRLIGCTLRWSSTALSHRG